jgi:hypothetical protein
VRGMNYRGLRLEMVAALGIAIALPALTAGAQSATTSTAISATTGESSAQTNPSGAVCSLTTVTTAVTSSSGIPTGTVTMKDAISGTPVSIGSKTLDANGQASFTFALADGSHTLTAVYAGDSAYTGSTSVAVSPTISSQCSSSFAVTVSSLSPSSTLTAGEAGTATVTVTPLPSFIESMGSAPAFITVSCSGLPQLTTCGFTPTSLEILPGENEGVTSALVLQTQSEGTTKAVPPAAPGHGGNPIAWAILLPGILGLGGIAWGARRRAWLSRLLLLALLGLITSLGTTACNPFYNYYHHGPTTTPATPAGSYTITLTGQSSNGVTAITNSTTMDFTVQ